MNQYNFNTLSPLEFEEFIKDILSAEHGIEYQTFSEGKDGGVDIRYIAQDRDQKSIVQCKRYSSVSGMMRTLIDKELPKVIELKPSRYILALSIDLSVQKVDELVTAFSPYILSANDIIMPKQLNSLLAKHPEVERRHFKLWLSSTNVLDGIINSGIENYSTMTRIEIEDSIARFVPLPNMPEAIEKLRSNGFIIITGQPGVGKTTLAKMMAYTLLGDKENGFTEFISIPRDFGEVLTKLSIDPEKYQVFYFDDFLGTNYLEQKLNRREDSVFHDLVISAEKLKKTKALIMTTRDYILQQAGRSSRHLNDQNILEACYILNLDKYGIELKTRILYNHIASFDMPEEHLAFFLDNKVYRKLITHRNYSPRLVEGIGRYRMWNNTTPEEFCDKLIASFDNPKLLYEHAFENEIDSTCRDVLLVLMTIGVSVRVSDLYRAVNAYNGCDNNAFECAIDVMDGTFIKTDLAKESLDDIIVSFSNASVQDFLVEYYRKRAYTLIDLVKSAIFLNQLIYVFARSKSPTDMRRLFGSASYSFGHKLFEKILVENDMSNVIEQRILNDRKKLRIIKSSGKVESYSRDLFDRASRLTADEITTINITEAVLDDLIAGLLGGEIESANMMDMLYVYEYHANVFRHNEEVMDRLADLIAASVQSFEDLSAIHDLSLDPEHREYMEDVIDRVVEYGNFDYIIDQEIQDRLSDAENPDSVVSLITSISAAYGITESEIQSRVYEQTGPPDIDEAQFYSRSQNDDTYEIIQERETDTNLAMDRIFESLRDY